MKKPLPTWLWALISLGLIILIGEMHRLTGYELNIFVFYFVPISISAWFIGFSASMGLAILSAIVWFWTDSLAGNVYSSHFYAVWNTMVRLISFIAIGWSVHKIRRTLDLARTTLEELKRAHSEIKVLEGILPICMTCKKIRNEAGKWERLEVFIGERSNTQFTHGYCPDCGNKLLEEAGLTEAQLNSRNSTVKAN